MARGDTEFCRVEVDFILSDPRYLSLSPSARCIYMWLWARAVKDRSENINEAFSNKEIAASNRQRTDTTRRATAECAASGLITIDSENRITVCGVRDKHKKLRGWEGEESDPYGVDTGPIQKDNSGSKRESKRESKKTTAAEDLVYRRLKINHYSNEQLSGLTVEQLCLVSYAETQEKIHSPIAFAKKTTQKPDSTLVTICNRILRPPPKVCECGKTVKKTYHQGTGETSYWCDCGERW